MNVIYKYQLPILEKFTLQLPKGAKILRVDVVEGVPNLWALVNKHAVEDERKFEMYKTGQDIGTDTDYMKYLGNLKLFVGQELCLYVFEVV